MSTDLQSGVAQTMEPELRYSRSRFCLTRDRRLAGLYGIDPLTGESQAQISVPGREEYFDRRDPVAERTPKVWNPPASNCLLPFRCHAAPNGAWDITRSKAWYDDELSQSTFRGIFRGSLHTTAQLTSRYRKYIKDRPGYAPLLDARLDPESTMWSRLPWSPSSQYLSDLWLRLHLGPLRIAHGIETYGGQVDRFVSARFSAAVYASRHISHPLLLSKIYARRPAHQRYATPQVSWEKATDGRLHLLLQYGEPKHFYPAREIVTGSSVPLHDWYPKHRVNRADGPFGLKTGKALWYRPNDDYAEVEGKLVAPQVYRYCPTVLRLPRNFAKGHGLDSVLYSHSQRTIDGWVWTTASANASLDRWIESKKLSKTDPNFNTEFRMQLDKVSSRAVSGWDADGDDAQKRIRVVKVAPKVGLHKYQNITSAIAQNPLHCYVGLRQDSQHEKMLRSAAYYRFLEPATETDVATEPASDSSDHSGLGFQFEYNWVGINRETTAGTYDLARRKTNAVIAKLFLADDWADSSELERTFRRHSGFSAMQFDGMDIPEATHRLSKIEGKQLAEEYVKKLFEGWRKLMKRIIRRNPWEQIEVTGQVFRDILERGGVYAALPRSSERGHIGEFEFHYLGQKEDFGQIEHLSLLYCMKQTSASDQEVREVVELLCKRLLQQDIEEIEAQSQYQKSRPARDRVVQKRIRLREWQAKNAKIRNFGVPGEFAAKFVGACEEVRSDEAGEVAAD